MLSFAIAQAYRVLLMSPQNSCSLHSWRDLEGSCFGENETEGQEIGTMCRTWRPSCGTAVQRQFSGVGEADKLVATSSGWLVAGSAFQTNWLTGAARVSGSRRKCHCHARNSSSEAVVLASTERFHNGGLQVDSDISGFVR